MSNRLALALALALVTSACTPGRVAIAAGAGSVLLGGAMFAGGAGDSGCGDRSNCVDLDLGPSGDDVQAMGAALLVGGALLLAVGFAAENNRADEPLPTSAVVFAPAQRVTGAPGAIMVSEGPAIESTATPAELAIRSRVENRLAIQASLTARRGDCRAAVATSVRLAELDPAMHAELVRTDSHLAYCIARAAAVQY
jgi:hypothetical protein